MTRHLFVFFLLFSFAYSYADTSKSNDPTAIPWVGWSDSLFQTSKKENKLVILDLEAIWCHWCHVMDAKTYSHPKVKELIRSKFIAVRVDQDARPDLSKRYEDYGWPATIFFDSSGKELAKRSGNIPPEEMVELLEALIKNPSPEKEGTSKLSGPPESPFLTVPTKTLLKKKHIDQYNTKYGGWGSIHKFLFGDTEEYAIRNAWRGDKAEEKRAKESLTKNLALIDPAWGGVYQYSVKTWKEPHFEKIAESQMKNLFLYSLGYSLWQDPNYVKAANEIHRFLKSFLKSPENAFYTSQDADLVKGVHSEGYFKLKDPERRKKGIPSIDKHIYSRENGWFIQTLVGLYEVSDNQEALDDAVKATSFIEKNRSLSGGGFRHDEKDLGGPYLGDTLEMGLAYLKLYEATADRKWLEKAQKALDFISKHFSYTLAGKPTGYKTSEKGIAAGLDPEPIKDENIRLARFANLMDHYTGQKGNRQIAEQAMRYLAIKEIAESVPTAGVLLADEELTQGPVHLTIVGQKDDPKALALFKAALKYPSSYRRVE